MGLSAYTEGYCDYIEGYDLNDNPFYYPDWEYFKWQEGWEDSQYDSFSYWYEW